MDVWSIRKKKDSSMTFMLSALFAMCVWWWFFIERDVFLAGVRTRKLVNSVECDILKELLSVFGI